MHSRYKLLAETMVDEMRMMRMNIFRWEAVHSMLREANLEEQWFIPSTLNRFEEETKWTHVLSARSK